MCGLEQQHHFLCLMSLTSPPVPRTGSQSKRRDANIVHKQTLQRERGTLLEKIVIINFTSEPQEQQNCTVCSITSGLHAHVSSRCLQFFGKCVTSFLVYISGKTYTEQNFYVKGSPTGSLSPTKSVTSSICLCPEGLWSPLTLSLNVRTLQFLSEYIGFHHPLG